MTYFLTGTDTDVPITTPDVKPPTWFQGLGAATESMMRRSDGFYGEKHTRSFVTIEKMDPILRKVGIDALNQYYIDNDAGYDHLRPAPENVDDFVAMHGDRAWDMVSEVAKEQAAADPAAWAGIDLSGEDITAETNQRLQDDQADADAILNSMPSGRGMAELVGGMVGMVADPRNVPFLLAGGGSGSLLSIMGREALLNVTAEAVTLPSRFKMADILEEPDPDVTETLLMAAGAGAVFGGAVEGLARALHYFRGRGEVRTALPGLSKQDSDLVITAVEDALVKGSDPVEAMTRAMRETAPPAREPLIPARPITPEPTALAPEPISTTVLPPQSTEELIGMADEALTVARENKPFLKVLRKRGGIDPDGSLGRELKAMGMTARSLPGLFKKGGAKDLDNLVASEMDGVIPGISRVTRIAEDGMYLDRDGVLSAILDEWQGKRLLTDAENVARAEEYVSGSEIEDFTTGQRAEGGLFIEPDPFSDTSPAVMAGRIKTIEGQLNDWLFQNGIRDLHPDDAREIVYTLAERGGDAKYLVERAIYREIDEVEKRLGGSDGTGRAADGRGGEGQPPAGAAGPDASGSATAGGRAVEPQGIERTAAGDQYVAPGIAATTERQRLEARQNARLQGGNRAADEGLFDVASRGQMDMFSDPASKEARVVQDAIIADFRDQIAKGEDVTVDLGDGKGPRTMSAIIKDMEADEAFVARLDLCGLMGGPTE